MTAQERQSKLERVEREFELVDDFKLLCFYYFAYLDTRGDPEGRRGFNPTEMPGNMYDRVADPEKYSEQNYKGSTFRNYGRVSNIIDNKRATEKCFASLIELCPFRNLAENGQVGNRHARVQLHSARILHHKRRDSALCDL